MSTQTTKKRGSLLNDISHLFAFGYWKRTKFSHVITPLNEAIKELRHRQQDYDLREKIRAFLKEDIPKHFREGPILYLARHVASPNFETLRFVHLTEPLSLPAVIGQDSHDRFVSCNPLKKALGKLPISVKITKKGDAYKETFENISVVDFNTSDGHPFAEVHTHWGQNVVAFHNELFKIFSHRSVSIVDDADWIDRHHRGRLLEHYKYFLALFLVHGILFEDYLPEDEQEKNFLKSVLLPAFAYIEKRFGYRPLITRLTPTSVESQRFWMSYPSAVKKFVREKFGFSS